MTLMHYLVEFIRTTYPKLRDFHEELDIAVMKGGEFEHSEHNIVIITTGTCNLKKSWWIF